MINVHTSYVTILDGSLPGLALLIFALYIILLLAFILLVVFFDHMLQIVLNHGKSVGLFVLFVLFLEFNQWLTFVQKVIQLLEFNLGLRVDCTVKFRVYILGIHIIFLKYLHYVLLVGQIYDAGTALLDPTPFINGFFSRFSTLFSFIILRRFECLSRKNLFSILCLGIRVFLDYLLRQIYF